MQKLKLNSIYKKWHVLTIFEWNIIQIIECNTYKFSSVEEISYSKFRYTA